jgi:acyl-CoA synthetase (AMP-forming)/AMP-acid ligase II/acyl carrier protein
MPIESCIGLRPSPTFLCLPHLLEHQARGLPDAPAILAPGRAPLTYCRLYQHIVTMGRTLRDMGIGPRDRIAVVLPNGPELAVAILTVAANAACAPVNPAFGIEELQGYFADLKPCALITQAGIDSSSRRAALASGVRVIELATAFDAEAGLFTLVGDRGRAPSDEPINSGDTALLLPTSGTTSRSKIVPQTHVNVCMSAYWTAAALALGETDRCLNVLPLFHGHGLNATVMASLAAGASVVCTSVLDASGFSLTLTASKATWYSAVPTMHQAILTQARHDRKRLAKCRLRFVRSSSAPLSPRIFAELEQTFESPVIEWYGMTEVTSSPIACNPLPPRERKPGSVGIPGALDVAIMDERGTLLPDRRTGEVVVRGASLTAGYFGNPKATELAFEGDWFKTGDLGYFDADGYLFLVGRIREIINRGGEKIAPQEVDEVLLDHPAVAEAVTFAVPHATLGEDVASAIVLRPHAKLRPRDVRQFVSRRIADFKCPRHVFIVREIPKGPTGKVQRIGLAAKLGLATSAPLPRTFVAPRTPLEKVLASIFAEVLQVETVSIYEDFFALGGDSLLAMRVLIRLYEVMHIEVDIAFIFDAPTVADMAEHIAISMQAGQDAPPSAIVRARRDNGVAPASIAQEWLCQLQQALPSVPFFNIIFALRLTSAVDAVVLERSINEIVRRHEILRTTFAVVNGRHVQVITPRLIVPLAFDDLRALPRLKNEALAHQIIEGEVLHSFDLAKGPLIRTRLLRQAEQQYLFVISTHQVICDGWSLGVFVDELVTLYEAFSAGKRSPLAPPSIQYADFASWQRDWQLHPDIVGQLAYWQEQFRSPLSVMNFARSGPRRMIDDFRTARREWALPARLTNAAKRFSLQEGGTLFMALVAALKTLLHRRLGHDDVRVAMNVANRNRSETKALIGPLVNTVILRTNLGGDPSAREVLRRVRATTLAALAHQDLAFEDLAEALEREHGIEPTALCNVMILMQNATLRPATGSEHQLTFEEANPNMLLPLVTVTNFDIILMLREGPMGLVGTCVYKSSLFGARSIDRLLREYQEVLEQIITQPERSISTITNL